MQQDAPAAELTRRVADVYLDAAAESPGEPAGSVSAGVTLSPAALAIKTGRYGDAAAAAADALVDVVVEEGRLVAVIGTGDRLPLVPASAERFTIPGFPVSVTFLPGPNGRPRDGTGGHRSDSGSVAARRTLPPGGPRSARGGGLDARTRISM